MIQMRRMETPDVDRRSPPPGAERGEELRSSRFCPSRKRSLSIPLPPRPCALVIIAAALSACHTAPPPRTDHETRAEDLLHCDDPGKAIAEFRQIADSSDRPEVKARAQMGIARCYLKLGNYRKALDSLYAARTLCDLGPQKEVYDRLFAEAAFKN